MSRCFVATAAISLALSSPFVWAQQKLLIGQMKASEAAMVFETLGDTAIATELRSAINLGKKPDLQLAYFWHGDKAPEAYAHTNHAFGFIPADATGSQQLVAIKEAGNITPDSTLRDKSIKITLDRLRVFKYPGGGIHQILFDFYGRHQTPGSEEDIHFSQTYRAQEGQGVGVTGYPVFVGLKVGKDGVKFRVRTVNVKNEDDERFLAFMSSDPFKNGLELINATNPLSPVVTTFATGLVDAIAKKDRNIPVQEFDMGLDFSAIRTRAKIREGSYIVVQAPDLAWDWAKWTYSPATGQIVSKSDQTKTIPYNYIVFSVSKMEL